MKATTIISRFSLFVAVVFTCTAGAQPNPRVPADPRIAPDVVAVLRNKRTVELAAVTPRGTPSVLRGELGKIATTGRSVRATDLSPVLADIAPALRLNPANLRPEKTVVDDLGFAHVYYRQTKNGLDVVGSRLSLHVNRDGVVYAAFGSARDGEQLPVTPLVATAEARARSLSGRSSEIRAGEPRLVYVITSGEQAMHLAWEVRVAGIEIGEEVDEFVFIDAVSGEIVDRHPQVFHGLNRQIYGATVQRFEGDSPTGYPIVDSNYDRFGDTYGFHHNNHNQADSYDNNGAALTSFVELPGVNNSFWSGVDYFAFGDGDGIHFGPMGSDQDIVTHEFAHGITQYSSGLINRNESGALNEAFSDIMAAAHQGLTYQVSSATWKIGEASFTPGTSGDALRYMDNPTLDVGIYPNLPGQSSRDYYPERYLGPDDGGGVHWNNGIANLAFCLLTQGGTHPRGKTTVNVPAVNIDKAHAIFYRAFTIYLGPSSQMIDARMATVQAASDLYGSSEATRTNLAWDAVGVPALNENTHPINFSTRANVGTGSEIMIMGFWLGGGTSAKPLLLRGVGPTLANFGVTGVMADPIMSLFSGPNQIASNDDWSSSPDKVAIAQTAAAVYAFALPDPSQDAAIVRSLNPGGYTLQISGDGGGTGNALGEIYDADTSNPNHLVNISTRCRVTSGAPMIGGLVISGQAHKRLLIRAVGPSLGKLGISGYLANPRLRIYQGGVLVQENDDWGNDPGVIAAGQKVYAFSLYSSSTDAAMLIALPPGIFNLFAESVTGSSGICMLEVYEVTGMIQ